MTGFRRKKQKKFQIQCGDICGVVPARTIGSAWRKLTKGVKYGFAPLARWHEVGSIKPWFYQTPQSLDRCR